MKPPVRLLEDPSLGPSLREDLEHASEAREDYDVATGLAALQAAIATLPAAGGGAAASAGAGSSAGKLSAAKLAAGKLLGGKGLASISIGKAVLGTATVVALGVGGANLLQTESAPPRQTVAAHAPASALELAPQAQAPQTPTAPAPSAELAPSEAVVQEPAPALAAREPAATPTLRSQGTEAQESAVLRRETAQLARVRALLQAKDPRAAYQLVQAGHRDLGDSMLWHEREALGIVALFELGRAGEAERRARALLARYPESAFRRELEQRMSDAAKPEQATQ